jgi:hypothetical protein
MSRVEMLHIGMANAVAVESRSAVNSGVTYAGVAYAGVAYAGVAYAGVAYAGVAYASVAHGMTAGMSYRVTAAVATTAARTVTMLRGRFRHKDQHQSHGCKAQKSMSAKHEHILLCGGMSRVQRQASEIRRQDIPLSRGKNAAVLHMSPGRMMAAQPLRPINYTQAAH